MSSQDQFTIYESDKPVMIETIAGTKDSGRKQWLIDEEVVEHSGNRDEPDGYDTHTLPAEDNLDSAVYTVLKRIQTQELDNVFQSEAECEMHQEEENALFAWLWLNLTYNKNMNRTTTNTFLTFDNNGHHIQVSIASILESGYPLDHNGDEMDLVTDELSDCEGDPV